MQVSLYMVQLGPGIVAIMKEVAVFNSDNLQIGFTVSEDILQHRDLVAILDSALIMQHLYFQISGS